MTIHKPIRTGVFRPSSNTALELLSSASVTTQPGCSAHFSRFTVTEISLTPQVLGPFDDAKILAAADPAAVRGWGRLFQSS